MEKLICAKCGNERSVPKVHDGPGVPSKGDATKLTCPTHGEKCLTVDIPECCGTVMKYGS